MELSHIEGKAAGVCETGGRPRFFGTIDNDGCIRIDSDNYPEHRQEIRLPKEWVAAYKAHYQTPQGSLPAEAPRKEVEVHADQAYLVDQNDRDYAALHTKMVHRRFRGYGEEGIDAVQYMVFDRFDLEPFVIKERFTGQSFQDIDGVYHALDCEDYFGRDREGLIPMLKVYGQQKLIRADSKFKVTFKH